MPEITQLSRLITTPAAAHEADRALTEWITAHAGPDQPAAKKTITTQGTDSIYTREDLHMESVTISQIENLSRSAVYTVHYSPEHLIPPYTAHATIIFPHLELGPGALTITVHQPPHWNGHTPPWHTPTPDPVASLHKLVDQVAQKDSQQRRRDRRSSRPNPGFTSLSQARSAWGPVVLLTPKGAKDNSFTNTAQTYDDVANIIAITDSDQVSMSKEVPDEFLREWLDANAILVKTTLEAAPPDHPLSTIATAPDLEHLLHTFRVDLVQGLQDMAQRQFIQTFNNALASYNTMEQILYESTKSDPARMNEALLTVAINQENLIQNRPQTSQDDTQLQQRISTLEDQLTQEKQHSASLMEQINDLNTQLNAYREYMNDTSPNPDQTPSHEPSDSATAREDVVMEAVTRPGRFPNLRFFTSIAKDLADYGKTRPRGDEIIAALDTIDTLAGLYLDSPNGSVGSWKEHLNLPGWTYANSESETTIGKFLKSRTFRDHHKGRDVTVQRHLTYRGSSSGLQIFFDSDEEGEPFLIAYIGEHLPYTTNRT